MQPLPMDNYVDLDRIEPWIEFFAQQEPETQLSIFESAWDALLSLEQDLIVRDLQAFILEPFYAEKEGKTDG